MLLLASPAHWMETLHTKTIVHMSAATDFSTWIIAAFIDLMESRSSFRFRDMSTSHTFNAIMPPSLAMEFHHEGLIIEWSDVMLSRKISILLRVGVFFRDENAQPT